MNITVFRVYQLNLLTAISMYMKSLFYLFLSIVGPDFVIVSPKNLRQRV